MTSSVVDLLHVFYGFLNGKFKALHKRFCEIFTSWRRYGQRELKRQWPADNRKTVDERQVEKVHDSLKESYKIKSNVLIYCNFLENHFL